MSETFAFYIKRVVIQRARYLIDADSEEEAREVMESSWQEPSIEWDTESPVELAEIPGYSTFQIESVD